MWNYLLFLFGMLLSGLFFMVSSGNLEDVKTKAPTVWNQNGFAIVGYQRFEWGCLGRWTTYGGAYVYFTLKRIPDNGILYEGALQRWGDEYHIYNLKAKDAIEIGSRNQK